MNKLFPLYADKTLDEFEIRDPSQEEAVKFVQSYITNLTEHRSDGTGLTLLGPAGTGKTHLAEMVLKAAADQGYTIESIELCSLIQLHQDKIMWSMQEDEDMVEKADRQIRRIRMKTDFVLFDDVGREHDSGSGWASQILFNILRYRSNRKAPFLLTTNFPLAVLDERYTEGLVSLLHEVTQIVLVDGSDYRCATDK